MPTYNCSYQCPPTDGSNCEDDFNLTWVWIALSLVILSCIVCVLKAKVKHNRRERQALSRNEENAQSSNRNTVVGEAEYILYNEN